MSIKIKILRGTVADGKPVSPGDVVEVTEGTARLLISIGKATVVPMAEAVEAVESSESPAPAAAENALSLRGNKKKASK